MPPAAWCRLSLPASGLSTNDFRQVAIASKTVAFGLVGNQVLRTTNGQIWTEIAALLAPTVEALDVDRGFDPVALFLAGSNGAWVTRSGRHLAGHFPGCRDARARITC